ncbi:MAG: hypothetical protein IJ708_09570 [Clostridia bacterium]|nr:hypothetical protein [Clostridia bacterium]
MYQRGRWHLLCRQNYAAYTQQYADRPIAPLSDRTGLLRLCLQRRAHQGEIPGVDQSSVRGLRLYRPKI